MLNVRPKDGPKARKFLSALYDCGVRFSLNRFMWDFSEAEASRVEAEPDHRFLLFPLEQDKRLWSNREFLPEGFALCSETFVRALLASRICSNAFTTFDFHGSQLFVFHFYFRHLSRDVLAETWAEMLAATRGSLCESLPSVLIELVLAYFSDKKEFAESFALCRRALPTAEYVDTCHTPPEMSPEVPCLPAGASPQPAGEKPASPAPSKYELVDMMIENLKKRKR
jgi:hypothetical protein